MAWRRRGGWLAAALVVGYVVGLVVANAYLARRVSAGLAARLQATFGGEVTIGEVDVALWRGTASARGIVISRGRDGIAAGELAEVTATFGGGGAVLLSRELHQLTLRDGRLSLSIAGLRSMGRPRAARLWARRVVVERLTIDVAPSASLPGVLSSRLHLARVVSGRTQVRSLVSWLESVQDAEASIVVPIVGDVSLRLHGQRLALRGSLLPREVALAYAPPPMPASATDGERIAAIVTHVMQGVSAELGVTWALQALIELPRSW